MVDTLVPPTKVGKMPDGGPYSLREGYTWTGICLCGFVTTGWPLRKLAQTRIDHHSNEHATGELMPPKEEVEQLSPRHFPPVDEVLPSRPTLWDGLMTAIVAGDIHFRASTTAGAAGNSTAYGGVDTGLGKYATSNDLADATLNAMFSDVTGAENAASAIHYQCLFVYNANASNAYQSPFAWLSAEVAGGASIAIGADTTAASAVGAAPAQGLTIANRTTAPAGVAFSSPTTFATGVALSTIPIGNVKGLWVRRTAANTAALNADGVTISVQGDTAAA
jgi:hypothetical protein